MLTCTVCNTDIGGCVCPDRDEGLRSVAYDPNGSVAFKWCRTCDKHYARCKCETPNFYVILRGEEWPVPPGGYENAGGTRTVPNFKER